MDSSEEPFTRSPCGLGVTALTIIPAMHSINIVWYETEKTQGSVRTRSKHGTDRRYLQNFGQKTLHKETS